MKRLLLALLAAGLLAAPAHAQTKGYTARPCGFDLDFDGNVGEAGECDFCDGVTTDPDGDLTDEDLIYVSYVSGSDSTGNGSPGNPYASISHAISVADGPGDGAEDIICFETAAGGSTNFQDDNINLNVSGVGPGVAPPIPSNGAHAVEHPDNPFMIIGWDKDDDGCYWPYDDGTNKGDGDPKGCGTSGAADADPAVLDGASENHRLLFVGGGNPGASYVELAHFEVKNYGAAPNAGCTNSHGCGFIRHGENVTGGATSHRHFHDIAMDRINYQAQGWDNSAVFLHFRGNRNLMHVVYDNIDINDAGGGYGWRGDGSDSCNNPDKEGAIRVKNVTIRALPCDKAACNETARAAWTLAKMWGCDGTATKGGFEWFDNIFDAQTDEWSPADSVSGGEPTLGLRPAQCSQYWHIANNDFIGFKSGVQMQPDDDSCTSRPISNIRVTRNHIDHSLYTPFIRAAAVEVDGNDEDARGRSAVNIQVDNNLITGTKPYSYGIEIGGNGYSGTCNNAGEYLKVNNNTIVDAVITGCFNVNDTGNDDEGEGHGIVIGKQCNGTTADNTERACMPPIVEVTNNVIADIAGGIQYVDIEYTPATSLTIEGNHYHSSSGTPSWEGPGGEFGTEYASFAAWQSGISGDASPASECKPTFVNEGAGDYHLAPTDVCAKEKGDTPSCVRPDIDGQNRDGVCDAGFDEQTVGGGGTTTTTTTVTTSTTSTTVTTTTTTLPLGMGIAVDPASVESVCDSVLGTTAIMDGADAITVGTQDNRILMVEVAAESNDTNCTMDTGFTVTSSVDGALTKAKAHIIGTGTRICVSEFYLLNPTAGAHNITATWSGSVPFKHMGGYVVYNAAQSAPTCVVGGQNSNSAISTNITSTAANSLAVDIVGVGEPDGGFTANQSGMVERWQKSCGMFGSGGASATKPMAAIGQHTMAWTHPDVNRWAHVICELTPSFSGVTTTTTTSTTTTAAPTTTTVTTSSTTSTTVTTTTSTSTTSTTLAQTAPNVGITFGG